MTSTTESNFLSHGCAVRRTRLNLESICHHQCSKDPTKKFSERSKHVTGQSERSSSLRCWKLMSSGTKSLWRRISTWTATIYTIWLRRYACGCICSTTITRHSFPKLWKLWWSTRTLAELTTRCWILTAKCLNLTGEAIKRFRTEMNSLQLTPSTCMPVTARVFPKVLAMILFASNSKKPANPTCLS